MRDIAAVAVQALTDPGHEGKAYTLSGPEALTNPEMATELSKVLGRAIRHTSLSPADYKSGLLAADIPGGMADWLVDLERKKGLLI